MINNLTYGLLLFIVVRCIYIHHAFKSTVEFNIYSSIMYSNKCSEYFSEYIRFYASYARRRKLFVVALK